HGPKLQADPIGVSDAVYKPFTLAPGRRAHERAQKKGRRSGRSGRPERREAPSAARGRAGSDQGRHRGQGGESNLRLAEPAPGPRFRPPERRKVDEYERETGRKRNPPARAAYP